jgi:peptidoglycan/xylan/chitin deacetylase (PgdA/CDA1 family)
MSSPREWLKQMLVGAGRQLIVPRVSPRVVVLCYHSISAEPGAASATPETFDQHLRWLKAHCAIVPFNCVADAAQYERRDRPVVSITFDDGYADNYEYAFPSLRRHGAPATFFLTAGFLERDLHVVRRFQRLCRAAEGMRPLEWAQVREMRQSGMEFGAHTYSHPNLARLTRDGAEAELRRSKDILEERLGAPVNAMAYPFGIPRRHFTRETMDVASAVGYRCAAAITFRAVHRSHCPFAIPRFPVPPGGGVQTLEDMIFGAWDFLGLWQQRGPVALQRRRWELYA